MYGSNSSSFPATLSQQSQPLRLTAESNRSVPTGGCHYMILDGSHTNQQCSCQSFLHNRNASGTTCDCGHSACYHATSSKPIPNPEENVVHALTERMQKLEDTILEDRRSRDSMMLRERQAWEREVRVLREALAPFYKSEYEMRRKLLEVEDRLAECSDHLDDIKMLGKEQPGSGLYSSKRRKVTEAPGKALFVASSETERGLTAQAQDTTLQRQSSLALMNGKSDEKRSNVAPKSPRSSGILNLASVPRQHRVRPPHIKSRQRPPSPPIDAEPRSSGFLSLDLKESMSRIKSKLAAAKEPESPENGEEEEAQSPAPVRTPPPGIVPPGAMSLPALLSADGFVRRSDGDEGIETKPLDGLMALDVLANVSAARPLVR